MHKPKTKIASVSWEGKIEQLSSNFPLHSLVLFGRRQQTCFPFVIEKNNFILEKIYFLYMLSLSEAHLAMN